MNYELFKELIISEMKDKNIWDDSYTFKVNKNIRGQSKSLFILRDEQKIYIAKYFNYTEDTGIRISRSEWESIKTLNDYIAFLDENYDVNIEEVSEGLYLKKRCFDRYVLASKETEDIFPEVYFSIDEVAFDCSICGILLEKAINGITLEEHINALSSQKKLDRAIQCIDFLTTISHKMYGYFSKDFVHRDLSPDNIMITESDGKTDYVIIDPGVVKIVSRNSTRGRVKFCKDTYSSPEQYLGYGSTVNFTSDIYILGIVIYEYVTGVNLIKKYYRPDILPHNEINAMLDRTVEDLFFEELEDNTIIDRLYLIIKKMLQCKKEDRFSSPESFVSVVETLLIKGDDLDD